MVTVSIKMHVNTARIKVYCNSTSTNVYKDFNNSISVLEACLIILLFKIATEHVSDLLSMTLVHIG